MPNPNGVAAQVLVQLAELTGKDDYRDAAKRTLQSLSGLMDQRPHTSEHLLIATSKYLAGGAADASKVASADKPSESTKDGGQSKRVDPVTMRASISDNAIAPGGETTVTLAMEVDEGWHLYAKNPQADFLIPTTVAVSSDTPITVGEVTAPKPESRTDPILKTAINSFSGKIVFKVPVRIDNRAKPGTTKLKVVVQSQACDDRRCLKPETTTLEIEVQIVGAK